MFLHNRGNCSNSHLHHQTFQKLNMIIRCPALNAPICQFWDIVMVPPTCSRPEMDPSFVFSPTACLAMRTPTLVHWYDSCLWKIPCRYCFKLLGTPVWLFTTDPYFIICAAAVEMVVRVYLLFRVTPWWKYSWLSRQIPLLQIWHIAFTEIYY